MNQMNQILIEGSAVEKATVKEPLLGGSIGTFTIAVNRTYRKQDGDCVNEVEYFDCVCHGNMADAIASRIKKGSGVRIVGRLKQERWRDSNGKENSKVVVLCEHIEFKPMQKPDNERFVKEV